MVNCCVTYSLVCHLVALIIISALDKKIVGAKMITKEEIHILFAAPCNVVFSREP